MMMRTGGGCKAGLFPGRGRVASGLMLADALPSWSGAGGRYRKHDPRSGSNPAQDRRACRRRYGKHDGFRVIARKDGAPLHSGTQLLSVAF